MNTYYLAIAGILVGLAGIIIGVFVSFIFYRMSLRTKKPCWAIRSNNLVQDYKSRFDKVAVLFDGRDIENLTVSKIAFWNDGRGTIDEGDIPTANPLRITCSEGTSLLDLKVLVCNNDASQLTVRREESENCAYLSFEYLDRGQGGVIQVVHTGTSSEDLDLIGAVKGVRALSHRKLKEPFLPLPTPADFDRRFSVELRHRFALVLSIFFVVSVVVFSFYLAFRVEPRNRPEDRVFFGIMCIFALLVLGQTYLRRRAFVPDGLTAFFED